MKTGETSTRMPRVSTGSGFDIAAVLVAIVMVGAVVLAFAAYESQPEDWGYSQQVAGAST